MLHDHPRMTDIDVDQWRNLHEMFLDSAKEKKRIIIIRDGEKILKFVHSHGEKIAKTINRIVDPKEDARKVYEENKEKANFVLLVDRKGAEKYFGEVQDSWNADEDLDEYVYRMYSKLDDYKDEIVTYPEPARKTLGLRWKLQASYPQAKKFVKKYIPNNSIVVIGIFENAKTLWGSLILGFDENGRIKLVTTVEKNEITEDWRKEYKHIIKRLEGKFWKCSLGLFAGKSSMEMILRSGKLETVRSLSRNGNVIVYPIPDMLQRRFMV